MSSAFDGLLADFDIATPQAVDEGFRCFTLFHNRSRFVPLQAGTLLETGVGVGCIDFGRNRQTTVDPPRDQELTAGIACPAKTATDILDSCVSRLREDLRGCLRAPARLTAAEDGFVTPEKRLDNPLEVGIEQHATRWVWKCNWHVDGPGWVARRKFLFRPHIQIDGFTISR